MKKMLRMYQMMLGMMFTFTLLFGLKTTVLAADTTYLEKLPVVSIGQYDGNMGDSFVYKIGKHKYTRGNTDINGKKYTHGLEAWIARWNFKDEVSWAYSTYKLDGKYNNLTGKIVLLNSYNTTNFKTKISFYGDGKLIVSCTMTPSTLPKDVAINVKGVKNLKILVKDTKAVAGGTSFGLVNFKVAKNQLDISKSKVADIKNKVYTGKEIKPAPVVTYNGIKLTKGKDYIVTYKNNKKKGTATVTIKGKGIYKGTKKVTFKIVK